MEGDGARYDGIRAGRGGRKQRLFAGGFRAITQGVEATVMEVGLGTFPNASYYFDGEVKSGPSSLDLVGVDERSRVESYATANLAKARASGSEAGCQPQDRAWRGGGATLPSKSADAVYAL